MRRAMWLLVCGLSTVSAAAGADAVGPGPTNCPRGAHPSSDHGGPYCNPTTCEKPADCPRQSGVYPTPKAEDFSCVRGIKLCVAKADAGGRGGPYQRDTAFGSCETAADCEGEAECVEARRCVKAEPPPASLPSAPAGKGNAGVEVRDTERTVPTPKRGCAGCTAGRGTEGGWWVALLGLFALRRRR